MVASNLERFGKVALFLQPWSKSWRPCAQRKPERRPRRALLAFCRRKDGHGFHQAPSRSGLGKRRRVGGCCVARQLQRQPRRLLPPAGSNLKRSTGTSKTLWRPSSYLLAALKPVYHQLLLSKKGNSKPRSRVASEDLTAAKAARAASSRHCEEPSTTHDGPNDE